MSAEVFMQRALDLADSAVKAGNHPFGAVLVVHDEIVLEAENTIHTENDVTRHAELNLVSGASKQLSKEELGKAVLYTSTEPCAMCSGAIYWAGIKTIIFAASASQLDAIAGKFLACHSIKVFEGSLDPPTVTGGVLEEKAAQQHLDYWPNL